MKKFLLAMWSTILIRGVLSIVFGLCALFWPGDFLSVITFIFGIYALIDGALTFWSAFSAKAEGRNRFVILLTGAVTFLVGLAAVLFPSAVTVYVVLLIGLWNVAMGLLQLLSAIVLRRELAGEFWPIITGIVSILFGAAILANWMWGVMAVATLIGITAIVVGAVLIFLALQLRRIGTTLLSKA